MLFNSYIFLFCFLPLTLIAFYGLGWLGHQRLAMSSLVAASLVFYGWWNPAYLGLILVSMIFNFGLGVALVEGAYNTETKRKMVLAFGVSANVAVLGYFKYANFFVDTVNDAFFTDFSLATIILPLAISFFTFQQIAYLVDSYHGKVKETSLLHYCLFVTFFPQLIAGPIVHHHEMMPQFVKSLLHKYRRENLIVGLSIFFIGLFKKVVLADSVAQYSSPVFEAAASGMTLTTAEAWIGSLGYTFQLYFDFSGYCDMAIGLARMFGVKLPLNFHSPYKAANISDFWRRWHITLGRFLKEYVYIPLGGNRASKFRVYRNLFLTMLIGGIWHGAGWTFVIWGALHGAYLCINHLWLNFKKARGWVKEYSSFVGRVLGRAITFLAVVVGWVYFRSDSVSAANSMLKSMAGIQSLSLPSSLSAKLQPITDKLPLLDIQYNGLFFNEIVKDIFPAIMWIAALFFIAMFLPNMQQIMRDENPVLDTYHGDKTAPPKHRFAIIRWKPNLLWAIVISITAIASMLMMSRVSEFLYFQF